VKEAVVNGTSGMVDHEADIRRSNINRDAKVIQCQLEGMFRKMYQSCTQEGFAMQLSLYGGMLVKVNTLFAELEVLADEIASLDRSEQHEDTNLM